MTGELALEIADHALATVIKISRRNFKRTPWTEDEKADARQEAALHIVQANARSPGQASYGYLYRAAQLAIYMWLRRICRQKSWFFQTDNADAFASSSVYPTVLERLLESVGGLEKLLREQRIKASVLTERHVQTDLAYLRLLLAGYDYSEIAFRMAMTRKAVWMVHDTLLGRLQRIAAGEKPPAERAWSVSEASLKALRRCSSDPEILRRRSESIRQAKSGCVRDAKGKFSG